jgi:phage terminase large subunit-like protein
MGILETKITLFHVVINCFAHRTNQAKHVLEVTITYLAGLSAVSSLHYSQAMEHSRVALDQHPRGHLGEE